MYCKQCGKELRDDEMFCSSCGTKAGEVKKTTFEMPDAERLKNSVDVFKSRLNDLGENKVTYLTGICLLLVSAFLLTKEMFAVSYTVFYTNSYTTYITIYISQKKSSNFAAINTKQTIILYETNTS